MQTLIKIRVWARSNANSSDQCKEVANHVTRFDRAIESGQESATMPRKITTEEFVAEMQQANSSTTFDVPQSDENSERLTSAFKSDPTPANYVRLRRANPKTLFRTEQFGGLEPVLAIEADFISAGIETGLVMGVVDADEGRINALSLQLLEKLASRDAGSGADRGKLWKGKEGNPLVDYLICIMIDSIEWNGKEMLPRDLAMLIKERMKGSRADLHARAKTREKKSQAVFVAAQMINRGEKPTLEAVSKIIGVDKTTVRRYFEGRTSEFIQKAKALAKNMQKYPAPDWGENGL